MSGYDSGLASRLSRSSGTGDPRQEIGTLAAPGVVAPGPDMSKSVMLGQMLDLMRGAGNLGSQIESQRHQTEAERRQAIADAEHQDALARRDAAEQRRIEGEAAMHDKGLANLHTDQTIISEIDDIRNGKLLNQPGDASKLVGEYLAKQGEGFSPAYRDELIQQKQKELTKAVISHREKLQLAATADNNVLLAAGARATADPKKISEYEDAFLKTNPNSTPLDAKVAVVLPALEAAAKSGSPDSKARMDAAKARLDPKVFEAAIRDADVEYQRVKDKQERDQAETFNNQISALRNAGAPAELVNSSIAKSNVSDALKEQQFNHTRAWNADRLRQIQFAERDQRVDAAKSAYQSEAQGLVSSKELFRLQDKEVYVPDGSPDGHKVELKAADQKQAILKQEFTKISDTYAKDPRAALNAQLLFSSQQGVLYDGWKQTFNSGYAGLSTAAYYAANDKEAPALPKQSVEAFGLFKQMKMFPGLLNMVGMDEQAKTTFTRATAMQQDPAFASDDAATLSEAVRRGNSPMYIQHTAAEKTKLEANVKKLTDIPWSFKTALNGNEIRTEMQDLANAKVEGGMDAGPALKSALEDLQTSRVFIGAHSINLSGMNIPPEKIKDLETVAAGFLRKYVEAGGGGFGLKAENLTLKPDRTTGIWTIRDASNNVPVPTRINDKKSIPANIVAISTDELVKKLGSLPVEQKSAEDTRILNAWASRRAQPSPQESQDAYWKIHGF